MDALAAIRETFFQECDEQLGELEVGLLAIEAGDCDRETVDAVFRSVHSIKGGAGAFKLTELVSFAHVFETTLDAIRNQQLQPTPDVLKVMLRSADCLSDLVKAARGGAAVDLIRVGSLVSDLAALVSGPSQIGEASSAQMICFDDSLDFQPIALVLEPLTPDETGTTSHLATFYIDVQALPNLFRNGNEITRLFRELSRIGNISVVCDSTKLPDLANLDTEHSYLSWQVELSTNRELAVVKEVFEFAVGDCVLNFRTERDVALSTVDRPNNDASIQPVSQNITEHSAQSQLSKLSSTLISDNAPGPAGLSIAQMSEPTDPVKADAAVGTGSAVATIRVDLDRVDRLINLVGELVINQAMLSQRVIEAGVGQRSNVAAGLDDLEHLTREIQEGVMAIRAQPVRPLFQRMTRIVREIADATGKSVRLRMDGEATEVDRTVIERLADPLTHMLRNAVDHGLEMPDNRLAAGKPVLGEVRLSAAHRSGRIAIEVTDDGAGIDRIRVKSIAEKKGLIPPDSQLTDSEIDNLLFLPGFSTAEKVSDISGRGVGMDVVKRSIQGLGGRISISSRPGIGTTFSLSLPLTLAVLDGMIVKVAEQTLVIPLTSIVETMKPSRTDIYRLGPDSQVIANRGSFVPLIDVGQRLNYRSVPADALCGVVLLVEQEGGSRCALMVDAIQDQRQVVIKSLEQNYGHVPGVAAATILGDGRIALILDVDAVVGSLVQMNVELQSPLAAAG